MKEKVEYGLLQKLFGSGKKQETGRSFESGRSHWTGMKCLETEREGEDKTRKLDTKPWQPCPQKGRPDRASLFREPAGPETGRASL